MCKKNMYEQNLKYIAISYRWGELQEQLVKAPDYIARINSFDLFDFYFIYSQIERDPDLKGIRYLWIDAISVGQYNNDEKKKETILQMTEIYKRATYILAVPDLHKEYLWRNPANRRPIHLIEKHKEFLYQSILNYQTTNENENNNKLKKKAHGLLNYLRNVFQPTKQEEIDAAYEFLIYFISDWAHRAWVIDTLVSYFISYDFEYYNLYLNNNKDSDEHNNIIIPYKSTNINSHFIAYFKKRLHNDDI
ncbi:hypothetical protein BJ944DRAFT_268527 [Cunninghamella echinulata]|nr:hypothetical protein BJ944DRAFT_268527 [Cunninghamella echinulata]